jgi:hypothetical protein
MKRVGCKSRHYKICVSSDGHVRLRSQVEHLLVGVFDDLFIEYLFDLVEQTRCHADDSFNYAIIKLIVCTHASDHFHYTPTEIASRLR